MKEAEQIIEEVNAMTPAQQVLIEYIWGTPTRGFGADAHGHSIYELLLSDDPNDKTKAAEILERLSKT